MGFAKTDTDGDEFERHVRLEERRTTAWMNVLVVLAVAAVGYTDWVVVLDASLAYLYVLPVALSALINPLPVTFGLAAVCTVLEDHFGPPQDDARVRIIRAVMSLVGFVAVGFFVTLIERQRQRLEQEVRHQRDEYAHDLKLAAQVQRQVLPKPPVLSHLELAATMMPARMLGGDYYDFYQISEDVVDVVIADVSGKGAAASLLMPSLAVALRLRARELSGPAAIMKDLDDVLKQVTNPATFVTMFYGRFNQANRTLEYACGGHNPPLLVRPKTSELLLLEAAGPIMGILPDAQYSNTVIALEPDDIFTMFTDGVTEQENEKGEQFSMDRLKTVVVSSEVESAADVVARVAETVSTFAGKKEQEDDLTVVVVKVL